VASVPHPAREALRPLLLLAVTTAAFALRMAGLADLGDLDFDEAATTYLASMDDPREMLETVLESFYHDPPLYYVVLHWWQAAMGVSEPALRALSVAFSTLAVAVIGASVARVAGTRAGAFAALVLAIAPMSVVFSRYARMYSLLLLSMALVIAVGAWRSGPRPVVPYRTGLAAIAAYLIGLGNHFYTLFAALATSPWLLPRRVFFVGLAVGGAGAGLWLLLSPRMREIMATMHPRLPEPTELSIMLAGSFGALAGPLASLTAYCVAAVVMLGAATLVFVRRRQLPSPFAQVVLAGWLVTTLAVPAMSLLGAPFANRYLVIAAPFAAAVAGIAVRFLPRAAVGPLAVGVLVAGALTLRPAYEGFSWGDYGHAVDRLRADARPGDGVLLNGMAQHVLYRHYRGGLPEGQTFPGPTLRDPRPVTEAEAEPLLTALVHQHPRVWVVESATNFYDPSAIVEQWLNREVYPLPLIRFRDAVLRLYLTDGQGAGVVDQPLDLLLLDVRLDSVALESRPLRPGDQARLRLNAHPEGATAPRKVSVRMVGSDGKAIWQSDRFFSGAERLVARSVIEVPPDAAPGTYQLQAVVYETGSVPGGGTQITRTSDPTTVATIEVRG
jgi:hypothetical protein